MNIYIIEMSRNETNLLSGRIFKAYLSSVISISLVLFLVGLVGMIILNARSVSRYFKENMVVSAILNLEIQDDRASDLMERIDKKNYVKSVDYISRETGASEMKQLLGDDFLSVFESSPIPISLDIHLIHNYLSSDSLAMIKKDLLAFEEVEDVVYQESIVDMLDSNIEKLAVAFLIFICLLLFISFVLINNTIRLNVYARRFTIRTMSLVGATKSFIVAPFLWKAFFQGLISGLLAVTALVSILFLVREEFYHLFNLLDPRMLVALFALVVIFGILICVLSTAVVVRKLITVKIDDLYY